MTIACLVCDHANEALLNQRMTISGEMLVHLWKEPRERIKNDGDLPEEVPGVPDVAIQDELSGRVDVGFLDEANGVVGREAFERSDLIADLDIAHTGVR